MEEPVADVFQAVKKQARPLVIQKAKEILGVRFRYQGDILVKKGAKCLKAVRKILEHLPVLKGQL